MTQKSIDGPRRFGGILSVPAGPVKVPPLAIVPIPSGPHVLAFSADWFRREEPPKRCPYLCCSLPKLMMWGLSRLCAYYTLESVAMALGRNLVPIATSG